MLFHVGALWRLNELGYLIRLERISSVSGGAITAAALGAGWSNLDFDEKGVAQGFEDKVVRPIRSLAAHTIDLPAVFLGSLSLGLLGGRTSRLLRKHLFGNATLQDLPVQQSGTPRFVFNATSLQSGVLVRFCREWMWDYRVGQIKNPQISLATVVAASSAFPPFLSPVVLRHQDSDFTPGTGEDLQHPPFTTKQALTDGGVYDNLGLETAWKSHDTVLVSDGGGISEPDPSPAFNWPQQTYRLLFVLDRQVRSLRKRQVIDGLNAGARSGAYWGIASDIMNFGAPDMLPCPASATLALAKVGTRLKGLPALAQERLINWGYAVCDAAMRAHVVPGAPSPGAFPYPLSAVG
jgi:NTE family protein